MHIQAERLAAEEREAQEKRENMAARKRKKAERKKAQRQHCKPQGKGVAGKGTLVQEFSSGKKEIWMVLGANHPRPHEESKSRDLQTNSHDQSHDNEDGMESDLPAHSVSSTQ